MVTPAQVEGAFNEGAGDATPAEPPVENPVRTFVGLLGHALFTATALNALPEYRNRELSLAITNLEQAAMWAEKAIRETA